MMQPRWPRSAWWAREDVAREMPLDPIGWTVHRLGAVDSTMTPARASARNGGSDRTVFLAREQIGGHGRHGRPWYSPPGNLYFTAVLCPDLPPRRAGECSLLMSVVLAEALGALIPGADLRLKWPNDVLLFGGKVAGLLPEAVIDGGALKALLLGIGVNVAHKPDLPDRATSRLADHVTEELDLDDVLGCILRTLDRWCGIWLTAGGFVRVRDAWLALGPVVGSPVSIKLGENRIDGSFRGLGEDGALLIRETYGTDRRILAGEVLG